MMYIHTPTHLEVLVSVGRGPQREVRGAVGGAEQEDEGLEAAEPMSHRE